MDTKTLSLILLAISLLSLVTGIVLSSWSFKIPFESPNRKKLYKYSQILLKVPMVMAIIIIFLV